MIVNGWTLYTFRLFKQALDELEQAVTRLAARDPEGYKSHPKTRLLESLYKAITQTVPANPDAPEFRLGKTLGTEYANWRRVKKGLPERYRLFFRFASRPVKVIVYAWVNDETADLTGLAGMVKASARGVPRRLKDFDPASLLTRSRRGK